MEAETDNQINLLDITIQKERDNLLFNVFRKPTATDSIIPKDSCHPPELKHAAIRYIINRRNTYDLNEYNKKAELDTVKHILKNNGYDTSVIKQLSKSEPRITQNKNKNLRAKFTYAGREVKFITKIFEESPIKVKYATNNTVSKYLSVKLNHPQTQNRYEKTGVYQLTSPDCIMKYIGQTGRSFHMRFQEHFRDFKYNNYKSKFAIHLLENQHSIGHINDIMEVLYTTNKGRLMGTIEKFYIHKETHKNNQINDKNRVKPNIIVDIISSQEPPQRAL
jgi:hypothetical protein